MTLARLFGRSPFAPLQTHMEKVSACVEELSTLFLALQEKNFAHIEKVAQKISTLEHEADLAKNDIRNHLSTGLFFPVARGSILDILSLQDNIADSAENVAILLTFRQLVIDPFFAKEFALFFEKNLETFQEVRAIVLELGELLESSFGGPEAEKVKTMVDQVAFKEHECDLLQRNLLKKFLDKSAAMATADFYLWIKVLEEVGEIANKSECLANRIRMILEVK